VDVRYRGAVVAGAHVAAVLGHSAPIAYVDEWPARRPRLPPGCVRRMLRLRTPWRKPGQARQNVLPPKAKRHPSLLFLPYTACLVSVTRKAVQPGQRLRCPHVYRTDCPRANSGLGDRDERKTSLYSNCICDMRISWNCSSRLRGCSVSSGDAFGRRGCCCGRRSGYRLHDGCRHTGPVPPRVPAPLLARFPSARLDQEGLPSGRGTHRLI
jgi:hypothetical protein